MGDFSLRGDQAKVESFDVTLGTTAPLTSTSGGAHVKGSWLELIASTSFDYANLILNMRSSTTNRTTIFDVAVGSIGNEEIVIEDFYPVLYGANRMGVSLDLPVHIPEGSRISVRNQSNASATVVGVWGHGVSGSFASPEPVSKFVSYGVDLAATKGTVIDPGAVDDTKGIYSELTSSTSDDIKGMFIAIGDNINQFAGNNSWLLDVAIGANSSEEIIIANIHVHQSPDENMMPSIQFFPINIPAGTRIAVRAQSTTNDATDRLIDVAVMGAV